MKRLGVLLALVLLASAASAQIVAGSGNTLIGPGSNLGGCTSSILTANAASLLACNPASVVNGSVSTAGRSILTIGDSISGTSSDSNFWNVTGRLTSNNTVEANAAKMLITTSATDTTGAIGRYAFRAELRPETSGSGKNSSANVAIVGLTAAETTATLLTRATMGIQGQGSATGASASASTLIFGGQFSALGQGSVGNVGVWGFTGQGTAPINGIGVFGESNAGSNTNIGGYFKIGTSVLNVWPTTGPSAALIAENNTTTSDIFRAQDNETAVQIIQDGGSLYSKIGTKALTLGGGAVTFVRVAVTSGSFQGGFIDWCADANDAADFQTRCGILPFSIVNKAGTETCTVGTPGTATESVAASAGTFTVAFTVDTATPTNGCDFLANGTSSLTETVMRINYTVRLVGNAATAVTAQ